MKANEIQNALATYRRDLPSDSKTAHAIDRGAPLAEISECAEAEGLYQLAAVLFEVQEMEFHGDKGASADREQSVLEQIRVFRADLPDSSRTAQAIDREASWEEISEAAEEEGVHQLAAMLFEAQQELR